MAAEGDSILIMPGNYSGAKLDKSLNITGLKGANLEGSMVVAAPGCIISHVNLSGPDDGPASARLLRQHTPGLQHHLPRECCIHIGRRQQGEKLHHKLSQGVEILGAKNEILESSISQRRPWSSTKPRRAG